MSKWKDPTVKIIQIIVRSYGITGLGSDSKIYTWSTDHGNWIKGWIELDQPNG